MLELYIGGHAQGKLEYVCNNHTDRILKKTSDDTGVNRLRIVDGGSADEIAPCEGECLVVNHLHLWVRERLRRGENPAALLESLLSSVSDCILISDEVGNGIVPMEPSEREYREVLGRILIQTAAKADRVERVICGLGQRLK
jgi:adenosyl cobinamide kinase/adenosyl cobinamide phosphate guanylyltransferase